MKRLIQDKKNERKAIKVADITDSKIVFKLSITDNFYESPFVHWLAIKGINDKSMTFVKPN